MESDKSVPNKDKKKNHTYSLNKGRYGCYKGILCTLNLSFIFLSLRDLSWDNILWEWGGKKAIEVMFHSTLTSNTRLRDEIITCGEPWWEKMLPYESQTAELLLFSSDKCWKVFFYLWKWNVKMTTLFQIRKQWSFFFFMCPTGREAPDYMTDSLWVTDLKCEVSQVRSPQENIKPQAL